MAITTKYASILQEGNVHYSNESKASIRFMRGEIVQDVALGDDGSFFEVASLPEGRVTILPYLCRYKVTALGASRVMKVGMRAYNKGFSGGIQAEDLSAFMSAIDVSAAVAAAWPQAAASQMTIDLYSTEGIRIAGQITGGTIPLNAVLEFGIAYVSAT